jgi:hypothetical protein
MFYGALLDLCQDHFLRLAVSFAVPVGSREVTVSFDFMSECNVFRFLVHRVEKNRALIVS